MFKIGDSGLDSSCVLAPDDAHSFFAYVSRFLMYVISSNMRLFTVKTVYIFSSGV